MIILGIETSCDETSASVVKDGKKILSNAVASSTDMHAKTGGIIPEEAAREQLKAILPVVEIALKESNIKPEKLDGIAVTSGPGLIGSLLVGVETAKTLAYVWKKPIVPINHLVGHFYANWLETDNPPSLPALALIVSGGHTDLVLIEDHGKLKWLGGTRDDAAGEAFDKTARLLELSRPDGPSIAAAAAKHDPAKKKFSINLPKPMLDQANFDFSFSGLKTAILREVNKLKEQGKWDEEAVNQLAYETQETIADILITKTLRALKKSGMKTLLVAGGVAANSRLKEKFQQAILDLDLNLDFRIPSPKLCTDNPTFVAAAAHYNFKPVPWQQVSTDPSLSLAS